VDYSIPDISRFVKQAVDMMGDRVIGKLS
jgi:hypothetical protein